MPTVTRTLARAVAAAACCSAAAAGAVTTVQLTARSSVNHFYWYGGFAISGDEGHDGAPLPPAGPPWTGVEVTSLAPATLAIAGSAYKELQYLFWTGYLAETWDQAQTYDLAATSAGVAISAAGHATSSQTSIVCSAITGCGLATESHRSTNTQVLEFTLSEASAYTLAGHTSGGQWVDLLAWNESFAMWSPVVAGSVATVDRSFDLAGQLQAGRYMVRNRLTTFSGGGTVDVVNDWAYALRFPGAVAAVPEPASSWMLLAGGLWLLGAARRRHR